MNAEGKQLRLLIACYTTFVSCITNAVNNVHLYLFYHCIPTFAPPCIDVELQCSEILYFAQRFFSTCEVGTDSYDLVKLVASMTSSKTNSFYVKKYIISNNHKVMISIFSISFAITLIANYFQQLFS